MGASYICTILEKKELLEGLFSFWIDAAEIAKESKAGQFVHILCGNDVLLRRPISICEVEGNKLRIVVSVKGKGTEALCKKDKGETMDILGPLGRGFDPAIRKEGTALLIGGGIGTFPLLQLAKELDDDIETIIGFRSKSMITMDNDFKKHVTKMHIATDDGSYGFKGLVTVLAEEIICKQKVGAIFSCGPTPMLKAVKSLAEKYDIPCQLSLEQRMACGVGVCMTCVCMTKNGVYAPVCKTGPVFSSKEVEFDA